MYELYYKLDAEDILILYDCILFEIASHQLKMQEIERNKQLKHTTIRRR